MRRNIIVDNPPCCGYGFFDGQTGKNRTDVRGTRREEVEPNPLSWTTNMIRTIALAVSAIALTVAAPVSA
ncbi:MAG TPA: hypothetical protein PLH31_16650, partial [Caulobacter sp.]|nr:hypothetical protein [Caulobacter sp.]